MRPTHRFFVPSNGCASRISQDSLLRHQRMHFQAHARVRPCDQTKLQGVLPASLPAFCLRLPTHSAPGGLLMAHCARRQARRCALTPLLPTSTWGPCAPVDALVTTHTPCAPAHVAQRSIPSCLIALALSQAPKHCRADTCKVCLQQSRARAAGRALEAGAGRCCRTGCDSCGRHRRRQKPPGGVA